MIHITNVYDFVTSLKVIRDALGNSNETRIANRLIGEIQAVCSHARAKREADHIVGKCPDCTKKFHGYTKFTIVSK